MDDDILSLIDRLIGLGKGDIERLKHIRKFLVDGKDLYVTDKRYLESLLEKYEPEIHPEKQLNNNTIPYSDSDPLHILKNRLAKGEITMKEFNELKKTLTDDNDVDKLKNEVKNVHEKMEKIQDEQNAEILIKERGKNESITIILSLVLGLIGLQGIGHMYVGKVGKGIGILILSLALFVAGIAILYLWAFGVVLYLWDFGVVLLIIYYIMFIWQIFDARKLCQIYNLGFYKLFSPKHSPITSTRNDEVPTAQSEEK